MFCWEDGQSVAPRVFFNHYKRLLKKAGIKDLRVHDMPHTFATLALEAGVSAKTVQEILGHEDIQTTLGIYAHVTRPMQEDAVKIMTGIISKAINN